MSILDWLKDNPADPADPREEAFVACRALGLDLSSDAVTHLTVGDFVRLAYTAGREVTEARLSSRDVADGIAQAIEHPESIIELTEYNARFLRNKVRAVQQVVAYGVPK